MAKTDERNKIEKVDSTQDPTWAEVTVVNDDGETRVIRVRMGSIFRERPKPSPA